MDRKIKKAKKAKEFIMTNLIKRKGLLYLVVIVAIVLVMAIACKKKPTQPLDTSLAGDSTEYQNPEEVGTKVDLEGGEEGEETIDFFAESYRYDWY